MKTSSVWAISFSLPVIIAAAFATVAQAQGTAEQTFINPKEIKWGDAPPSLPKGAKIAVLHGDPGKAGPFNLRLMTPAGYKIPPHGTRRTRT